MDFVTTTLDSLEQLGAHAAHGWLYRGQASAAWALETAFERCCNRSHIPMEERPKVEYRLCREFRRAYHQYASHVPRKTAMLEWFALMQHHGAPTRLLDFTYSIYVAAYFALEQSAGDCAVWGINSPWALSASVSLLEQAGQPNARGLTTPYDEQDDEIFNEVFLTNPVALWACAQTPFRLNERLRIQMGSFMAPGRVDKTFEDNLRALPGYEKADHLKKIVISSRFRDGALRQLFDMSISRRTLFPGLDGFAQSLAIYSPAFNPIRWWASAQQSVPADGPRPAGSARG